MKKTLLSTLACCLLLTSGMALAATQTCLGCHDFGPDSPVHPMLEGSHGETAEGCEGCHGPSREHTERPTIVAPDTSFGPRWSASVAQQDSQCLACHADNVASHWQDALHMSNKLTCVSCHDMHTTLDKVLNPEQQSDVCTVCHKAQKSGIHALEEHKGDNPVCTTCHSPHGDQSAVSMMLANRSEGCRTCHDLVTMAASTQVTEKAKSYHKVMVQTDRTCLDCHQGVTHGPANAVPPFVPMAVAQRRVTLFYPGQSDIDWVLSEHPGAQPFRQGSNCQQCHRGEEASMGTALGGAKPASREIDVRFQEDASNLFVTLSWEGDQNDADIAFMWGDDGNSSFQRGGCWAACHSDMPGMSRDRDQGLGKYLSDSRAQQQRIGQPPLVKGGAALQEMMKDGNFVEMWRIKLGGGQAEASTAVLLADLTWSRNPGLKAEASHSNGRWQVKLQRPLQGSSQQKTFLRNKRYTFGLAMNATARPGAKHWVSLPMTLSLDGDDTDFLAD